MPDISFFCRRLACWLILFFGISSGTISSAGDNIGNTGVLDRTTSSFAEQYVLGRGRTTFYLETSDLNRQEVAQGNAWVNEFPERQAIRNKLIVRANKYIESATAYSGEIVATAFVVDGLIKFGLSPEDLYLQEKVAWLKSQRAANDKVYDSSGRFLPLETAWVYRSIYQFKQRIAQLKIDINPESIDWKPQPPQYSDDSLFAAAAALVQNHLADFQSAIRFLNNDFSQPTLADNRGRAINEYQLSHSRYHLLATWDQYVTILHLRPALPLNSPLGSSMFRGLIACGTSSVSSSPFSKSTENVSSPLSDLEHSRSRVCRQNRREGYFVFGQTTVLLI